MTPAQRPYSFSAMYAARDFLIGLVFLYGYVYSAYKYGNPLLGGNDFFKYKEMVEKPFDFSATTAPFVLRQIPAIVASIFYKLGFYYDTEAVVDLLGLNQTTKRQFFALILSNALAVCLSFTVLANYFRTKLSRDSILDLFTLFGLFAAWFYFPTAAIAPLTVGWGWLASSLFVIAFVERNPWVTCLACLVGLFSRETTLIFALIIFLTPLVFEGERNRNVVSSVLILIVGCITYLVLRELGTSGYEHQIAPKSIISNLGSVHFTRSFFFQSILTQGLLLIILLVIAIKRPRYAAYLLLATAAVTIVAFGAGVSQISRLLGESLPFYVAFLMLAHAERFRPTRIRHDQLRNLC